MQGAGSDDLYKVELRPQWPKEGNSPSTLVSGLADQPAQHDTTAKPIPAFCLYTEQEMRIYR